MVEHKRTRGEIWTFIGAKGGVGKTTLATNVAALIASETEHSALVIDLDTRFGDIALLFDLRPSYSIADLAQAFKSEITPALLEQALTRHDSGAAILAAPAHPREWGLVEPEIMKHIVRLASEVFDYVILDTPGAFTDLVGVAIEETDQVLLATTLERTSVRDSVHLLELMRSDGLDLDTVRLIVDEVHPFNALRPEDLAKMSGLTVAGHVPYDEEVVIANALGHPVVLDKPGSPGSQAIRRLASSLMPDDQGERLLHEDKSGGLLGWIRGAA